MSDNKSYPKGCSLSAFVKAKRREQGWTQVQLADALAANIDASLGDSPVSDEFASGFARLVRANLERMV